MLSDDRSCLCRHLHFRDDAARHNRRQAQLRRIAEDQLEALAQCRQTGSETIP